MFRPIERRSFLKTTAAAAATAASAQRVLGANDRIRIGLVGCGGRGTHVAQKILEGNTGVEYSAFADVFDSQAEKARQSLAQGQGDTYRDFRLLLERDDLDAVHVATPDHWHAIPAILALRAGKHVYCEKPLGHNVLEGQAMVAESTKFPKQVFLTGTQHRSQSHFMRIARMVESGELADVHFVRVWNYSNLLPDGLAARPDQPIPETLDWDMYLGPAPWVPYNPARTVGTYRAFFDYAGGWITDFGVHRFDTVHQIMGRDQPLTVNASGSRYAVGGLGDQPDVLQVTYEYPGFVLSYEAINTSSFGSIARLTPGMAMHGAKGEIDRPNGMAFYGSNGTVIADRLGYETVPPGPKSTSRLAGGASEHAPLGRMHENNPEPTLAHGQHFIRCIREGERPRCDALTGHRSSLVAHLGNVSYKVGRKLWWDGQDEKLISDPEASKHLGRVARKPWDLVTL